MFTPIELEGGNRWIMIVTAPESEVTESARTLLSLTAGIAVFFIALVVALIFLLSGRITKPLQTILEEANLLIDGDFRQREVKIHLSDEIGHLAAGFCKLRTNLHNLLQHVTRQSINQADSSRQLTLNAQQSADAATQIAEAVTQIAGAGEQQEIVVKTMNETSQNLTQSMQQISQLTQEIAGIAQNTASEARNGENDLAAAGEKMGKIESDSLAMQQAIHELSKGSMAIREIVDLISTIAGQTNLLALNAAIEAARAGEQGRGFAVVAEEVRKLAEESNQAALKIGELIQKNQVNMDHAVEVTKAGTVSIQDGISTVHTASESFDKIVKEILQLSNQIQEIAGLSAQVASQGQELLHASQQVDQVSKQNVGATQTISATTEEQSASMEEIAAASQLLAKLAQETEEELKKFKV